MAGGSIYVVDHVEHGQTGKILRLHADGTTETVSIGKIKDLSSVALGRSGALYATSFRAPFVGRLDAAGRLHPLPVP